MAQAAELIYLAPVGIWYTKMDNHSSRSDSDTFSAKPAHKPHDDIGGKYVDRVLHKCENSFVTW